MANKIDYNDIPVKLLIVSGSPRKKSNSGILLDYALEGVEGRQNIEVERFYLSEKRFDTTPGKKDDFEELAEKWDLADAVIWAMPIYTAAGPGLIYDALDRLSKRLQPRLKESGYKKAAGIIMQGSETYGMVELGLEHAIRLFASLHCIPVYRLAGRVPDKEPPKDQRFLDGCRDLGKRVVETARILKLAYQNPPTAQANVLILNAGVDDPEIGLGIAARVEERLSGLPGIGVKTYSFAGKKIEGCHHCNTYCGKHLECAYKDGFQEFREKWLNADGIIWISSANYQGPPAIVRCALDRLSEVGFSSVMNQCITRGIPYQFAKYTKPEASISYGNRRYGGQELSQQFFFNHAVLRGNLPVAGSDPQSALGPAAFLRSVSQLGCDQFFTEAVDGIADDIAELSRRVLTAKLSAYESIPEYYFPSRKVMGITDKGGFIV